MSNITQLDLSTLEGYSPMNSTSSTSGGRLLVGAETLRNDLINVSNNAFQANDQSTAHSVIDAVSLQISRFYEDVDAINVIIDSLIDDINNRIVEAENEFADSIPSKL